MSYFKSLDEYSYDQLREEIVQREKLISTGHCPYCHRLATENPCKEKEQHDSPLQRNRPWSYGLNDYQRHALRTSNLNKGDVFDVLILALGLAGEAGEVADYIKKVYGHGHELDIGIVEKELGDVLWYLACIAEWFSMGLSGIANANIEKLKQRYPEGFSPERSKFRDRTSFDEPPRTPQEDVTKPGDAIRRYEARKA